MDANILLLMMRKIGKLIILTHTIGMEIIFGILGILLETYKSLSAILNYVQKSN